MTIHMGKELLIHLCYHYCKELVSSEDPYQLIVEGPAPILEDCQFYLLYSITKKMFFSSIILFKAIFQTLLSIFFFRIGFRDCFQ